MNLVFWGKEHQSGTTAHMMAATGMLRALYGKESVVTGRFMQKEGTKFALCDCGTGLNGRRRHFLWHADLVVVNLRQKKCCIEHFFEEDFHIAKNMVFLLGGYDYEEDADIAYLRRVYRIEPEQAAVIPYNSAFYQAVQKGKSDAFIARELCEPSNMANEQFVCSVQTAVARMMIRLEYEFKKESIKS